MGRLVVCAAGCALLVGVWSDGSRGALPAEPAKATPVTRATACAGYRPLGSADWAYAAVARGRVVARARPGGRTIAAFGPRNENGFVTVFAVLGEVVGPDCAARAYRVQLPIRPNGAKGYVRARDVVVVRLETRVEVDLSDRRLEVFRAGRRVLSTRTAVGRPGTPTPTGRYYVNQLLLSDDPAGVFGPGGVGISAFSPTLTNWPQGGPIAIHGTDQPATIGRAASLGCLRVANEVVRWFFRTVPAGTPVVIRP